VSEEECPCLEECVCTCEDCSCRTAEREARPCTCVSTDGARRIVIRDGFFVEAGCPEHDR
jgi:hypothetical protein